MRAHCSRYEFSVLNCVYDRLPGVRRRLHKYSLGHSNPSTSANAIWIRIIRCVRNRLLRCVSRRRCLQPAIARRTQIYEIATDLLDPGVLICIVYRPHVIQTIAALITYLLQSEPQPMDQELPP